MAPIAKTRAESGAINVQVSLKAVMPVVLQTPKGRRNLKEDVERIGCTGLLNKPWNLKDEGLVQELIFGVPIQFDFMVRGKPE